MLALQSQYRLLAQFAHQIGIFAIALHHSAPAWVLREVEDRTIDIGVSQRMGLFGCDASYLCYQFPIPRGALSALCRERSSLVVAESADTLIGKVHRDAQACLLHKPALNFMAILDALGPRKRQFVVHAILHAIALFIDVSDAVFPDFILPILGRIFVFQHTARAIERGHLASLLVERHLAQQIGDSRFHCSIGVFVDVHDSVLVEVYPSFSIHVLHIVCGSRAYAKHHYKQTSDGFSHHIYQVFKVSNTKLGKFFI